jgi:hypothetical protein
MPSRLHGRRIHLAGSIPADPAHASAEDVHSARAFVELLVAELVSRGASFVVPVDAEKTRAADNLPICFDWLVWKTLGANLDRRPAGAINPLAIAVLHHKSEDQVPPEFERLWEDLRASDLVQLESAAHWNMASKRMETQARWGDILIAIGGSEGVLYLANLYHDAGRPIVPLNLPVCAENEGARKLFNFGLSRHEAPKLFQASGVGPHGWLNRINFRKAKPVAERVTEFLALLEALSPPKAFAVRLLNPRHADFAAVDEYFVDVVKPVVEEELGFELCIIDGRQPLDHARIDQEIFVKLHRSSVVIADITGLRPNCFLELGYALGRGLPTMLLAKDGNEHPFDIYTLAGLHWNAGDPIAERKKKFREHWAAIRTRPPLVSDEPLI